MNPTDLAFPFKCQGPTTGPETYYGMDLRTYMATQILSAIIISDGKDTARVIRYTEQANDAVLIAEALIARLNAK